jgi:hypothetical protein
VREYWSIWSQQNQKDTLPRKPLLLPRTVTNAHEELADEQLPTLYQALEWLSDRYDLTILVDSKAFEAAGIDKVGEQPVRLPQQKKPLPQEEFLRLFLEQVHGDDYTADCVYRRDGYFEVVPRHNRLRDRKPLESRHLDKLWQTLESGSAASARLIEQTLVQAPREALPYLREHLKPAAPPDPQRSARIKKFADDLESDQFAARQKAMAELEKLGDEALPALRDRLAHDPPLDVTLRIEKLLKKLTCQQTRTLRCVRVLEAIGTDEAREQLKALAAGDPGVTATQAARDALKRVP